MEWAAPHFQEDKMGSTTGEQGRPCKPGFQCGETKVSKPLAVKICGGCSGE